MHCHRNSVLLLLISLCILPMVASNVEALTREQRDNFVSMYEKAAFADESGLLIKPHTDSLNTVDVLCINGKCTDTIASIEAHLPTTRFQLKQVANIDPNSLITLVLLDEDFSPRNSDVLNSRIFKLTDNEHVFSDSSENCASVTIFNDKTVRTISIAMTNSSVTRKNLACFVVQLAIASGLKLNGNFENFWNSPKGLNLMSYDRFEATIGTIVRLLSIHFSPKLKPEMSLDEFSRMVKSLSDDELFGVEK